MNCYVLVLNFRRHRRSALARLERVREEYRRVPEADLPTVTVQLPVYNERYVVGRVIQAVCHLHWPHSRGSSVLDGCTLDPLLCGRLVAVHLRDELLCPGPQLPSPPAKRLSTA